MPSPDNTVISQPNQSIADAAGYTWSIINGQVAVNGVADPTTGRVIEMAYEGGQIWQENADDLWWSKASPGDQWTPTAGTVVVPIPGWQASSNDSVARVTSAFPAPPITDASGNTWTVVNGQVAVNGVADPTTARVIALAYVNGQVWQENADNLWWAKTRPSDTWTPEAGTSTSPVQAAERTWSGVNGSFSNPADWTPTGVPQLGDTAVIPSGNVSVTPGFGLGVNFVLQGSSPSTPDVSFQANPQTTSNSPPIVYAIGTLNGHGEVSIGYAGESVLVTSQGISQSGGLLSINEFINGSALEVHGNSSLTNGASFDVRLTGTASLGYGILQNDGTIKVKASNLTVGTLMGHGTVAATGGSNLTIDSAVAGETIQLRSAHLVIGDNPVFTSSALQFLAPVTGFGAHSSILLNDTDATSAIFEKSAPTAGELFVYNNSTLVADLHISGQANVYASLSPASATQPHPGILITPYDTGRSLPPPGS